VTDCSRSHGKLCLCVCDRGGTTRNSGDMAQTSANIAGKRRTLPNTGERENEADVDLNDNAMFLLTVSDDKCFKYLSQE